MRESRIVAMFAVALFGNAIPTPVSANLYGTDLNLSAHPVTGGMAGAGYTLSLEPSAALFGNPASLTQVRGIQYNLGATYFHFFGNDHKQEFAGQSNTSTSANTDYLIPVGAATFELVEDLVLGFGVEVATGAGVDYRSDPITLLGTPTDMGGVPGTTVPALAQVIAFNGNLGMAYEIADVLSIGAAFTLGFGFLQVGTAGNTTGLDAASGGAVADFGGTTSTVQDFGFGASVGLNLNPVDVLLVSVAYKSSVKYKYDNVISTTVGGPQVYQRLELQQPQEVVFGVALRDIAPELSLAFDVVWKNWENADAYKDVFKNQWLILVGGQYVVAEILSLRLGYSYATLVWRGTPNNAIDGLTGLGTIPFGDAGEPFSSALMSIVQTGLTPVVWQHNITVGGGVQITDKVSLDAYFSFSIPNEVSRSPAALSEFLGAPVTYTSDMKLTLWVGAGVKVAIGAEPEEPAELNQIEIEADLTEVEIEVE